MSAYSWADIWNHDAQFGFVCGCFVGAFGLVLTVCLMDLLARLVLDGRPQPQQRRVRGDNGGRGL